MRARTIVLVGLVIVVACCKLTLKREPQPTVNTTLETEYGDTIKDSKTQEEKEWDAFVETVLQKKPNSIIQLIRWEKKKNDKQHNECCRHGARSCTC
jgi:hypothetical protein